MINYNNIGENFNKYKKIIIEVLTDYYGVQYKEVIKRRLDNVFFDFSSTPEDDYIFLKVHKDLLDNSSKLLIKLRYYEFKNIQRKEQKSCFRLLIEYIKSYLEISNIDEINIENEAFLSLFTDKKFNSGYIDAFSSKSISLLGDSSISKSVKESIIHDQEEFKRIINSFGIKIENLSREVVDKLLKYRKKLQDAYKSNIVQKSIFGKTLLREIKKMFSIEIPAKVLNYYAFREDSWAGYICIEDDSNLTYYQFIKNPLLHYINSGIKGLDVILIHEIIHKVESNDDYIGISTADDDDVNHIINEVRTQNLAIKITKKLHELGIYIYDNPDDYTIEGESTYELLFPLIKDFLDENETLLSDCAINNTPKKLNEYFGEFWEEFGKKINSIYYDHMHTFLRMDNIPYINENDSITELINNMRTFKNGYSKNV